MSINRLKPSTQRVPKKKIYGFDIETYGEKNHFLCASLFHSHDDKYFFTDLEKLKAFLRKFKSQNVFIVATNLQFDFFGVFGMTDVDDIKVLFSGSHLLTAKILLKTYVNKKGVATNKYLTFIDTMNYIKLSVKVMGDILKVPKLDQPICFGKIPSNKTQWAYLEKYNHRAA